jgi:hypothetical protein
MSVAKIQLSAEELELVQNAGWLLTKNTIIDKVFVLFGEVAHSIREQAEANQVVLPADVQATAPKISRGENYEGLPYVMLDYPRLFGREDLFAIRVFFWWGHYFSITLHLKGIYRQQYAPALLANLPLLAGRDFSICIAEDEWRHHFAEDNYTALKKIQPAAVERLLSGNRFCKLSASISLNQWSEAKQLLVDLYQVIFQSLGVINYPAGEKDL